MSAKTMTITAGLFAVGLAFGMTADRAEAGGYYYAPVAPVVYRPVYVSPAPIVVQPATTYVTYGTPVYYHRPVYRTYYYGGCYRGYRGHAYGHGYRHHGSSFGVNVHYRH